MPRVPTYDNFQVNDSAPPAVRFDAPQAQNAAPKQGQDMGNALMSAGGAMARIQQDIDQTRVSESMNSLMEQRLALTYKDGGYVHLSGKDALERPDNKSLSQEYGERLKKSGDDITGRLGNDRQKKMFSEQLSKVMLDFDGDITRHVAGESRKWQLSVHDGTQRTAINYAAANFMQTDEVDQSRNAVKQSVFDQGQLLGKSAVEIQADQVDALSVMHSAVMTSAVDSKNIDYAREYYKQNESELNAPTRMQLTKLIEAGDFEKRTQDKTDELWAKHGGDPKAAIAEARKDKSLDGKVEDAVISRLKVLANEKDVFDKQVQDDNFKNALTFVNKKQKVPASVMAALTPEDNRRIQQMETNGTPEKTNINKWLEFTNLPPALLSKMTPQDLMRQYGPHFTDSDIRNADQMIQAAKGLRGGKPNPEGLQLATTQDLMQKTAKELGILPKTGQPSEEQLNKYALFREEMQTKVNREESNKNIAKLSNEDLAKLLNKEKMNAVRYDEWGADEDRPYISLTPEQQATAYVNVGDEEIKLTAIPVNRRAQIIEALQANGSPVTESEIARLWVKAGKPK